MSFSKKLFLKEYRKSFSYLSEEEQVELRRWVREARNEVSPVAVGAERESRTA